MTSPEIESLQPQLDHYALERSVHQLGLLYGVSGLQVAIKHGAGTSCSATESGLIVTIDPKQVVEGDGRDMNSPEYGHTTVEINALFMTAHELGHAKDFLDPAYRLDATRTADRAFFDCLIDDTVIDKRNRRVPLFDSKADAVYAHQLPQDLTEMPKHVQLMYGIRITNVVNNPELQMSPEVEAIMTDLTNFERDGATFDIPAVLTDPRTSLSERRRIANTFILPHYEALLEQDKQDKQDGQGEGSPQDGNGNGDFQDAYSQYEQAVHGHRGEDGQPPHSDGTPDDKVEGAGHDDLAQKLAEALKTKADNDKQAKESAKAAAQASGKQDENGEAQDNEAQLSELAGTLAGEMKLSQGDAESYVNSLDRWAPTIKAVSDVFMELAAPAGTIRSPRYKRGARTEGVRLHPKMMASVALQLTTDQEQAIWQPIVREARRQYVTFGGLDVHLLVDVSGSMQGSKAQCAADTALCLIEGLQLARHKVAREAGQYHQPDVRTQVIAFGSGTEVISPLSHTPSGQHKGKTYSNLLRPNSNSTLVNGALERVVKASQEKPKRDVIAIIISDGIFGDHSSALQTMAKMPRSAYVSHLVIGGQASNSITDHTEAVGNPNDLPSKLYGVLAGYIR